MNRKKDVLGIVKQYGCLVFGIVLMAASVALAKVAKLGTSPISSIPNVLSELTPLTIGVWTILFMVVLISLEWYALRQAFGWRNLIQIFPSVIFGVMIDGFVKLFDFIHPANYLVQLALTLVSIVLLAIGVFFEVNSHTLMMAGEGVTAAFAQMKKMNFGKTKVRTDSAMVAVALIISLVVSHQLIGVREGTILSALLSGRIVGFIEEHFPALTKWVQGKTPLPTLEEEVYFKE